MRIDLKTAAGRARLAALQGRRGSSDDALGRLPKGTRNATEAAYEQHLEEQRQAGAIRWYRFEGVKLRLAKRTTYTPDFAVVAADGVLELHECKGRWRDDAKVKFKVAIEAYPLFRFRAVRKGRGGWIEETF
jgi:hypothetical protein